VTDTRSHEDQQKTNTDNTDDEADHESGPAPEVAGYASGVHQCLSAQRLGVERPALADSTDRHALMPARSNGLFGGNTGP
jgi:hypothetical protein